MIQDVLEDQLVLDEGCRSKTAWFSPVKVFSLEPCIARDDIKNGPDLAGCEQIRVPIMSNPTYLTHQEVAAMNQYIPANLLKAAGWTKRLKKLPGKR